MAGSGQRPVLKKWLHMHSPYPAEPQAQPASFGIGKSVQTEPLDKDASPQPP